MVNFDWHAERADLSRLALLDRPQKAKGLIRRRCASIAWPESGARWQNTTSTPSSFLIQSTSTTRPARGTCSFSPCGTPPSRYLLLTAGRSILFEFKGCLHLASGYETIDEVREAKSASARIPVQETASYVINENELVALNTDVVGCHGYY